mgnify:CR=1 FL=1
MTTRQRLLLIRGLGHSGTTILDLALGAHPSIVGLGEAVRILERPRPDEAQRGPAQLRGALRHERSCTCGKLAAECPVWGPLLECSPCFGRWSWGPCYLARCNSVDEKKSTRAQEHKNIRARYQESLMA